ncbi:iron-sulfur cluster assembly enzyme ISCU-like [Hippopotamus amphibius kiboko]|uniref:iron-sulfur cluster assembly enzyme ISCU-like n=1 Tax=Hippopotamus amphibius kiboko TaxID=575201 RepID=UPI0025963E2B|nr:iron-sulfur cluster assembly enzyme ISCU-like [Hippopotamus amphibius kiboko]
MKGHLIKDLNEVKEQAMGPLKVTGVQKWVLRPHAGAPCLGKGIIMRPVRRQQILAGISPQDAGGLSPAAPGRCLPARELSAPAGLYHKKVVDRSEKPQHVGSLDKTSKNVGTGLVGAPACGDIMKLQIQADEKGKIGDATFKTFGCGSVIASSSLATEWVKGKAVEEALTIKNAGITTELCLPPVKLHCSMLTEDAVKAALADDKWKREPRKGEAEKTGGPGEASRRSHGLLAPHPHHAVTYVFRSPCTTIKTQ